jgi:hypothetical protein
LDALSGLQVFLKSVESVKQERRILFSQQEVSRKDAKNKIGRAFASLPPLRLCVKLFLVAASPRGGS